MLMIKHGIYTLFTWLFEVHPECHKAKWPPGCAAWWSLAIASWWPVDTLWDRWVGPPAQSPSKGRLTTRHGKLLELCTVFSYPPWACGDSVWQKELPVFHLARILAFPEGSGVFYVGSDWTEAESAWAETVVVRCWRSSSSKHLRMYWPSMWSSVLCELLRGC